LKFGFFFWLEKYGKYKINMKPKEKKPVTEFLKTQSRFKHLFKPENQAILEKIVVEGDFQPQQTPLGICFMLQNKQARSVQISGSFNNWIPEQTPLAKAKDGLWYTILPLKKGNYEYQYVVDGKYTLDPNNPTQQTSKFGVTQSVVEIHQ